MDVESGLVDAGGKGEGGMNWESGIDTYILPFVNFTAGGSCYIARGAQLGAP